MPDNTLVEEVARALYEHWVSENIDNEFAGWERLGDKQTWIDRAQAAVSIIEQRVRELEEVARRAYEFLKANREVGASAWPIVDELKATLTTKETDGL